MKCLKQGTKYRNYWKNIFLTFWLSFTFRFFFINNLRMPHSNMGIYCWRLIPTFGFIMANLTFIPLKRGVNLFCKLEINFTSFQMWWKGKFANIFQTVLTFQSTICQWLFVNFIYIFFILWQKFIMIRIKFGLIFFNVEDTFLKISSLPSKAA